MTLIIAPNKVIAARLDRVLAKMQDLGAPTIKAYWDGEKYWAVEGSHRLAAAKILGLTPVIEEVNIDDEIEHDIEGVDSNRVDAILDYLSDGRPEALFDFNLR